MSDQGERRLYSAVRLSGEVYFSSCCHSCAQKEAARARGWTLDELNEAVVAGRETYAVGYVRGRGEEFVLEDGE